ncbi:hypothetical protein LEP1GSC061_3757 [Leptospira wolffii serovar Khorat str. Khorat-H2]|nr:hypothetical protein LEP1GSC061_3757 [Leptospira wolffii serovar Khorat str. Khorat-H2]
MQNMSKIHTLHPYLFSLMTASILYNTDITYTGFGPDSINEISPEKSGDYP